mmetsp:Transcript_33386/g.77540  ORF Transcript_33386/g.77540 Transcript_33386/m.77540 type:complete len:170 (+) Transcript_33386:1-510(+)
MVGSAVSPNQFTFSALIGAAAKADDVEQASEWVKEARMRGLNLTFPGHGTWVSLLCRRGLLEQAQAALDRVRLEGWKPDAAMYTQLMRSFAERGRESEAVGVLERMLARGLQPTKAALRFMADYPLLAARAATCKPVSGGDFKRSRILSNVRDKWANPDFQAELGQSRR